MAFQVTKAPCSRPFTSSAPSLRRTVAAAPRRVVEARPVFVRAAEPEAAEPQAEVLELIEEDDRSSRRGQVEQPQFKQFLPLPKPAHLVYIKPTVAVVAGMASRSSVGLKMTAGDQGLERYVIEFYSKSVK